MAAIAGIISALGGGRSVVAIVTDDEVEVRAVGAVPPGPAGIEGDYDPIEFSGK